MVNPDNCQTCGTEIFLTGRKWLDRFNLKCTPATSGKTWTAPHIPRKVDAQ
jgi:hypothetical protein